MATITRLQSLAGVRISDTSLAKAAVDLLEAASHHLRIPSRLHDIGRTRH